jgi:hypothetical protein
MLCCTLAGIAGAAAGATTRHLKLMLAAAALGPLLLAAWHLDHYAARAQANERDLLAEILAAPICTGSPIPKD